MYEDTDAYEAPQEYTDEYQPEYRDGYGGGGDWQEMPPSNIISTSQAINLTCTLASISLLFGLFLCFADQKSHAVRRYAIQSVGLGAVHVALGLVCWILSAVLGWIPIVGYIFVILMVVALIAVTVLVIVQRVRLMLHAYRGEAFVLPVIGEKLRRFE